MSIRLLASADKEIIYQSDKVQSGKKPVEFDKAQSILKHRCIEAVFDEVMLDEFGIRHSRIVLNDDIEISDDSGKPVICMYFNLSGSSDTLLHHDETQLTFTGGQHNLIYMPFFNARFNAGHIAEPNDKLEIHFTESFFNRLTGTNATLLKSFLGKMAREETSLLSDQHLPVNAQMQVILQQILHTNKTGIFKKLYLESKILELLMLQLEAFGQMSSRPYSLKKSDIEKLHYAKALLEQNLTDPPSLIGLARETGLNDFKLKKGFKALFCNTVFGHLHELRMLKARELLYERQQTLTEIAEYCGYQHVQHFITAFKRAHGLTPGQFLK